MSITKVPEKKNPDLVIIRGFGDRPAALEVVGTGGGAVDVVGKDRSNPMPFHIGRAYRFDRKLYSRLKNAFERKDSPALERLWSEAERYHTEST